MLTWLKFYPAEGDSAIAELWDDDRLVAELSLAGIELTATGRARVARASPVLATYPGYDARAADSLLSDMLGWLITNECGRTPD